MSYAWLEPDPQEMLSGCCGAPNITDGGEMGFCGACRDGAVFEYTCYRCKDPIEYESVHEESGERMLVWYDEKPYHFTCPPEGEGI